MDLGLSVLDDGLFLLEFKLENCYLLVQIMDFSVFVSNSGFEELHLKGVWEYQWQVLTIVYTIAGQLIAQGLV